MSIQVQSTFRFWKWANASRPIRRLLLSGFPLVLTTKYFGMTWLAAYVARQKFQSAMFFAVCSALFTPCSLLSSGREKNFVGIRIFHRRAGSKTAHIDV